jgi:endonuclease/exonuclease/phosphatase family metal-dependent hydrolase
MPAATFFRRFAKRIMITLNCLTAIMFLAGCYASWFNPDRFWFIGFFTLASFYLLLVLIFFIVFWLFTKPRLALLGTIVIILAWSPMRNVFRIRTGADFTMKKNTSNLRVMSWNVEHFEILKHKTHPEIKHQMLDLINQYQPDVACFQEMVGSDSFPEAINYVPDIAKAINMPYYYYSYNRKLDFDNQHHFGIITFSRYPFVSKHTLSYAPNDYNSIFQYTDIATGTDTFRIFNLHLQSLKFTTQNLQYLDEPTIDEGKDIQESMSLLKKFKTGFLHREVQSVHVRAAITESPFPAVVCGDFNDVPNSFAYSTIGKGLKNAFTEKGAGVGRTFSGISPTLRIDNIFTDPRFSIEQYTRVDKKMSDHFPIMADVFYNKAMP